MNQECWRLINNVCWCETALKLNELSSGSSEWPQPQPSVVPDSTPLPLIRCSPSSIVVLPILRGCPLRPPSSPSPSSVAAFSILRCCLLHPPSSSFPFSIISFSILHRCPSHPPSLPSPSSVVLPILHHLLLHPSSLSFPLSTAALSTLHRCPLPVPGGCRGWQHRCTLGAGAALGSAKHPRPGGASTEAWEPPAECLFAHDLKFRDFSWTPLGKKGVERSGLVP